MKRSLIVPIAADSAEYETVMPYLFALTQEGLMLCVSAIMGLDIASFDGVYFTILKKHSQKYLLREMFELQFKRLGIADKAFVVELETPTANQPETIYQTIQQANISGAIFIKDADSYFTAEVQSENLVYTYPLDSLESINPQNKSYVNVDDMYYITNIIEKRIIGSDFCSGGYSFERASDFVAYYEQNMNYQPLYMSHIIYSALLDNKSFRPVKVSDYKDWGTVNDWKRGN